MNKYIIYTGILAAGLILGWLFFGNSSNEQVEHNHTSDAQTSQMWTCSMHPQIMQPQAGDCPICGMDLIPVESNSEGLAANEFKMTPNAMALANIETTVVGEQLEDDNTIKLSGKIAENQEANSVQASYFSGRIERLNINFTGEQVKKGQLLATIYSPELYAAQQELITAASLKESQPALYKAVRNKLKLWKLSDNQISEIESSGKIRENFPVYATVSGTVTQKLVDQGDYVKQGQPLLKIANLATVWANFDVYESQIELFKKGQLVAVTTKAFPNKLFNAKVDFIDPILDARTRTVKLRVVLTNSENLFKPGMFVEGRIASKTNNKEQVITIPATAVLWTGERSVVYIKTAVNEPVFKMRQITLGSQIGEQYQVLDGLIKGEEIVTNGTFTVDAAAQLQGKKSMMNKDGGKTMTGHEGHLGTSDTANGKNSDNPSLRIAVTSQFRDQLTVVFDNYILLKDALVSDNATEVVQNTKGLLSSLEAVDMSLLTNNEAHKQWMTLLESTKTTTNKIAASQELKEQRTHFKQLSTSLGEAVQVFGINKKVFEQFCPMADNDKGATWLSVQEKVINPYFGSAMLTCGEVINVIQ
jgi:Cu(I)/Ag(I) efflux system membrane fusion protein